MAPDDISGCLVWVMAKGYAPDEGGMQTYARGVAEAYADVGALVTVFTQTSAGPRRAQVGSVQVVDIGAGKGVSVPFRLLAAMRRERLHGGAPLFVHGTTWRMSVMPMLLGLRYATTFHGREFMYAGWLALLTMRAVARRALGFVAVSRYSADKLRRRLGTALPEAVVAWNGIGNDTPSPVERAPNSEPFFLSLCRLEPRKNIAACLHVCTRMQAEGREFRYAIAGRGPELEQLRRSVEQLGLADKVEILGFVSDERARELYARADIFLHPQIEADGGRDFEGFGIAIADAMFAGAVPIVGREGGAAELIEEGVSGLAVDGRNPDALAAALTRLLDDPERRSAMSRAAAERARDNFTWAKHIAIVLQAIPLGARRI